MNRLKCLHPDVVSPMKIPEWKLHTSQDPLFLTTRNETYYNIPMSDGEAFLQDESKPLSEEPEASANEKASVKKDRCQLESSCTNEKDVIAQQVKSATKELITTELATMTEKSLYDILNDLFHHNLQKWHPITR